MRELVFTSKNTKDSFALTDGAYNFPLQKPMLCPICGAFQDGTAVSRAIHPGFKGIEIGTIGYRCTHCAKCYLVVYKVDRKNKNTYFAEYYPQETASYENEILSNVSPQFIESYNQALRAELRGDIELAAIGYRKALERVVKDYAINELGAAPEEVVLSAKTLPQKNCGVNKIMLDIYRDGVYYNRVDNKRKEGGGP